MNVTLKSLALVVLALSPAACASEPAFEAYSETGSGTDSQSGDDGDDMGSDGVFDSSSESGDGGMPLDIGMADGDESESGDASGDGDAGDGDGDDDGLSSASTDSTTGDGDGDGDSGMDKFPGDLCDPFIDTCLDIDGDDYVCAFDNDWLGGNEYEWNFKCQFFWTQENSAGMTGDLCNDGANQCQTGYYCASGSQLDEGICASPWVECCASLCAYGDVCGGGEECSVTHFQSDLTDYLDIYTGIGFCPSG